jgi:hypothetical protein
MPTYLAVIADVVRSRELAPPARARLQEQLREFLATLNQGFAEALAAEFVITTGDEFQGLLKDGAVIPDLVWALRTQLPGVRIRLGVGYGRLHTELLPQAIGMDGPVFHAAREAIVRARKEGWDGGVFRGFGDPGDGILNGIAHLLERQVSRMTPRQRALADQLRNGVDQTRLSEQLRVTRQAVNKQIHSLGWKSFAAGEEAFRMAIAHFTRAGTTA